MSRVVKDELKEMEMDIDLQEQIYAEIEEEILQWLVSQTTRKLNLFIRNLC